MRLTKTIFLAVLLSLITATMLVNARQDDMSSHKGPRNSESYLTREVRPRIGDGAVVLRL